MSRFNITRLVDGRNRSQLSFGFYFVANLNNQKHFSRNPTAASLRWPLTSPVLFNRDESYIAQRCYLRSGLSKRTRRSD